LIRLQARSAPRGARSICGLTGAGSTAPSRAPSVSRRASSPYALHQFPLQITPGSLRWWPGKNTLQNDPR
jgi:hypothetical protein